MISQSSDTSKDVANPQVISNQSTYYEVWFEWDKIGSGTQTIVDTLQPVIAVNTFADSTLESTICSDAFAGNLLTAHTEIKNTLMVSGSTVYYIDIVQTVGGASGNAQAVLGSGLSNGDAYPINQTTPASGGATIEDTATLSANTNALRIPSISQNTIDSDALNIIFSTGLDGDGTAASTFATTFIGFFWTGTDSRVRQEYYYEAVTSTALGTSSNNFGGDPPVGNNTDAFTNDTSGVTLLVKP